MTTADVDLLHETLTGGDSVRMNIKCGDVRRLCIELVHRKFNLYYAYNEHFISTVV